MMELIVQLPLVLSLNPGADQSGAGAPHREAVGRPRCSAAPWVERRGDGGEGCGYNAGDVCVECVAARVAQGL